MSLGRYLQGFEVCRRYGLRPDPLPEADTQRMDALLWEWRRLQSSLFDQLREADEKSAEAFNVNGDHMFGDLWAWEKYADDNYRENLSQYASLAAVAVVVGLLIPAHLF